MVSGLEEQVKRNQRHVMECVERLDSLYERLQLDIHNKFQFLAENQGKCKTVLLWSVDLDSYSFKSPSLSWIRFCILEVHKSGS